MQPTLPTSRGDATNVAYEPGRCNQRCPVSSIGRLLAPDKAEEYAKNGIAGEWDRLGAQWR
jgi:hypothetical protein